MLKFIHVASIFSSNREIIEAIGADSSLSSQNFASESYPEQVHFIIHKLFL